MSALDLFTHGDGVSRTVALLLLLMSVASWVVILWKSWLLRGGVGNVLRGIGAFWQSPTVDVASQRLQGLACARLLRPMLASLSQLTQPAGDAQLASQGAVSQRLTRALRDALHGALHRLQSGQILLATVGATAPFVGLLGTVWGIHGALTAISSQGGAFTIDKVAGPVGEALVMTAFGLAVAIPAVLAYNIFGRAVGRIEAELEGFAHDLLATFAPEAPAPAAPLPPARPMPVTTA